MIATTTSATTPETLVGMGEIIGGQPPQLLRAVVGSCVALALYHPRLMKGVMAHVVLPSAAGHPGTPGKFADTAVPNMLQWFRTLGLPAQGLSAKLAGGANMFGSRGPVQIGEANVQAVARALQAAGIRIAAQDVGGARGRRVTFDCGGGGLTIESAGQAPKTL